MADFPLDKVSKSELLTLKHDFLAGSDELLAAFTSADLFKRWYAPAGWAIEDDHFIFEPKIGGRIQVLMKHESGSNIFAPMYLRFESMTDTLLEFTEAISGPDGQPSEQEIGWRIRFVPGTVVTGDGVGQGTTLVLEQGPLPESVHEQAKATWHEAFGKLEEALKPTSSC